VHGGEAGDDGVVLDDDVAAEGAVVGEDDVVADLAVVGDVRVAEEEVVVADDRRRVDVGAAVNRGVFPEDVAVADEEVGRLALILQVLGLSADGGEGEELVGSPDLRRSIDDDVRLQHAVIAELDSRADDTERPDPDVVAEEGVRGNDRGGMDHGDQSQPTRQPMATVFLILRVIRGGFGKKFNRRWMQMDADGRRWKRGLKMDGKDERDVLPLPLVIRI
jgi:hypothetical protein